MNIVIVGAGAIGLLFYQQLYPQCCRLKDINSRHQLSLKTRSGTSPTFSFTHYQGLSYQIPITIADNKHIADADAIFICVKSYQVDGTLNQLIPYLKSTVNIILCHNGMGVLTDQTRQRLSEQQTLFTLLTTHGSKKLSPKHIMHTGLGFCDLGLLSGTVNFAEKNKLISLFADSHLNVQWQDNIMQKQWLKLAINCVINPLTAINNINNGDIRLAKYQTSIHLLIKEFITIAASQAQYFDFESINQIINDIAEKTALNRSSMCSDIINQLPTEIDYINGYLVRLAIENKIAVPENKKLCQQIHQLTKLYYYRE